MFSAKIGEYRSISWHFRQKCHEIEVSTILAEGKEDKRAVLLLTGARGDQKEAFGKR